MSTGMNWARRRAELAAAVPILAGFTALYAWSIPTSDPEETAATAFWIAVLFAMPTVLWLFTAWLLIHLWWEGNADRLSKMDAMGATDVPGQLLASAATTLPDSRRHWGEAMLGELAHVRGRTARWRFALSCARAALFLPPRVGRPVLVTAAGVVLAAMVATRTAVSDALPGLGLFAAGFVAVLGLAAVLAIARARRISAPVSAPAVLVIGAVAASVAAIATFLFRYPDAAEALSPARALILAAALSGSLWLAVAPPRRLGSGGLAPYLGVAAAVLFTLGGLAVARFGVEGAPALYLLMGPVLTFMVPAFVASAVERSRRAGIRAGLWTAIAVMPLNLAVALTAASYQYAVEGRWTFAGDTTTAGFTLGFTFMTFMEIVIVGLPFAVLGATVAALLRKAPTVARNLS